MKYLLALILALMCACAKPQKKVEVKAVPDCKTMTHEEENKWYAAGVHTGIEAEQTWLRDGNKDPKAVPAPSAHQAKKVRIYCGGILVVAIFVDVNAFNCPNGEVLRIEELSAHPAKVKREPKRAKDTQRQPTIPNATAADVPPKEWDETLPKDIARVNIMPAITEPGAITIHHATCEDKKRYLLERADGTKHCIRLAP